MRHSPTRPLVLTALLALVALTACAQPPSNGPAPPMRDDTRASDHADRGMKDSHQM